jgi:sugar O-acyltransferase (sialic acid O-acetyltransferase NeuD family)
MNLKPLVILGASGFGREVAWLVQEINQHTPTWNVLGFIDRNPRVLDGLEVPFPLLGDEKSFTDWNSVYAVCAIGAPEVRKQVVERLAARGVRWASLIHPTAFVGFGSTIGEGAVICRYAGVTVNAQVGRHVHINLKAGVDHDTRVGDFCTLSPFVDVAGQAVLEEGVFLGTHAAVLPKARVGAWSKIGAGSVVLRSVQPGQAVLGVPAKSVGERKV